jgi:hypothetical protein
MVTSCANTDVKSVWLGVGRESLDEVEIVL